MGANTSKGAPALPSYGGGSVIQSPINLAGSDSLSLLGTQFAPLFPSFLTNNPLPNGFPWGSLTSQNANPYQQMPDTGVTRTYAWTLTKQNAAPDGVEVPLILVNGQYPGPVVEANWGDWIQVTVTNNMTDEQPAAIHWHGLLQKQTPWMDGVPGVSQCPIAIGSSFTYKFRADLYGTSWYHSHIESQYASGSFGPIVIHGPDEKTQYDVDVGPVMVNEYYHEWWEDVLAGFLAKDPVITRSDNNLINGKNSYMGNNAPLASFNFTSGKTMRLRFINPSASAVEKISIDGHTMTVIANDFVPLQPYDTTVVTLAPGQRTDVLVKGTGSPNSAVWLRAFKPPNCSISKENSTLALAAIFYQAADRKVAPASQPQTNAYDTYCGNDPLSKTVPLYPLAPGEPSVTEVVPVQLLSNGSSDLWYQAGRTMVVDYNDPILLDVKQGDLNFAPIRNVHDYGANKSLRFVFENPGQLPHPIHLHGHNFFVLQEGACTAAQVGNGTDQSGVIHKPTRRRSEGRTVSRIERRNLWPSWLWPFNPPSSSSGSGSSGSGNGGSSSSNSGTPSGATVTGPCWDGTIVNPQNPQRRDVQMLLPGHYIVLQWNQDNPGTWPLHCHIAWHASAGFVWMVLENPAAIQKDMQIPGVVAQTCPNWDKWTSVPGDVTPQSGSGLRVV
ncbi:Cu-oxidase 3-domain-containing protein [Apiospora marii]|uniref:Cu-oxidase 3-domain-containing protein n=1 Tax=Apiospora marii TaxID=335849 RepID=A0ABR1RJF7_9PEZI